MIRNSCNVASTNDNKLNLRLKYMTNHVNELRLRFTEIKTADISNQKFSILEFCFLSCILFRFGKEPRRKAGRRKISL